MTLVNIVTGIIIAAVLYVPSTTPAQNVEDTNQQRVETELHGKDNLRTSKWFVYIGPSPDDPNHDYSEEIKEPANYVEFTSSEPTEEPDCDGNEQICAVNVLEGSSGMPDQDDLNSLLSSPDPSRILNKDIE